MSQPRARVSVALLSVCLVVFAQLVLHDILPRHGSNGAGRRLAQVPAWCARDRSTPVLSDVGTREITDLRALAQDAVAAQGARRYASGVVTPEEVWSDESPSPRSFGLPGAGQQIGSFEIREWAPDPQWGASYDDDIVGDDFLFATPVQARRFFDEASSATCHAAGIARPAAQPSNARTLVWVNPDGETEEDVFLLSRRLVYRIADVRPQRREPPPSEGEQEEGVATVEAYACDMTPARCQRSRPQGSPGRRAV